MYIEIFQLSLTIILCVERIFKRIKKSSCCNHFIDLEMNNNNESNNNLKVDI
jgi:hypothetical protein